MLHCGIEEEITVSFNVLFDEIDSLRLVVDSLVILLIFHSQSKIKILSKLERQNSVVHFGILKLDTLINLIAKISKQKGLEGDKL